jgi:hypothetical protein
LTSANLLCGVCANAVPGLSNATDNATDITATMARQILIADCIRFSSFSVNG